VIVLDTHAWILLINGSEDLSGTCQQAVEQSASAGEVYVPAVAVWELASLEQQGKLTLSIPCAEWVRRAVSAPGLSVSVLTPEIAVEGANLPGSFHRDPIDRIIVATARLLNARVATSDERILDYGRQGYVGVLAA